MLPNQQYYFITGKGAWSGAFHFRLTDKDAFKKARPSLKNRLLVKAMLIFQRLFGNGTIDSEIVTYPNRHQIGSAYNVIRIHKGITLYLLKEEYILHPNGEDVKVVAEDRFGPLPFLFRKKKVYTAKITDGGAASVYWMPLLGDTWECRYKVEDENNVSGILRCGWGESTETIRRV